MNKVYIEIYNEWECELKSDWLKNDGKETWISEISLTFHCVGILLPYATRFVNPEFEKKTSVIRLGEIDTTLIKHELISIFCQNNFAAFFFQILLTRRIQLLPNCVILSWHLIVPASIPPYNCKSSRRERVKTLVFNIVDERRRFKLKFPGIEYSITPKSENRERISPNCTHNLV